MIKQFFKLKSTKIVAILALCALFLLTVLTIISVFGYAKIFGDIENFQPIKTTHTLQIEKDENGVTTIRNTQNTEGIKVLQISDMHIACSIGTYAKDKSALNAVYSIVKNTNPDLIVLTGDYCYPFFLTLSINNRMQTDAVGKFFEKIGIPWTLNFGNHEDMGLTTASAEEIAKQFLSFENCLFSFEDGDVYGEGNYYIKVLNNDETFNSALFFIDTNGYISGISKYDKVHDDQVEWYKKSILKLSNEYSIPTNELNTILFTHIPMPAYKDAFMAYKNGEIEIIYGKMRENIGSSNEKDNLFNVILELGSTKAVFCGHDHLNTAGFMYKGVLLSYGMSIDYLAYLGIHNKKEQRGGQIIYVKEDNMIKITQVPETNNYLPLNETIIEL